jgi:hypothetical protein
MGTTDTTLEIEADAKSKVQTSTSPYWEKFARFERDTQQPRWVLNARKAGISRFVEIGFPTVHDRLAFHQRRAHCRAAVQARV